MGYVSAKANAKVNLSLNVLSKLPTGYHEIESVIQEIDICDEINIRPSGHLKVNCNIGIPEKDNIVMRAAKLVKDTYKISGNATIDLHKNIPIEAGLGGGSSDAVAVIKALGKLWKLGISASELEALAAKLGSDTCFFVHGKTQLATGRGEKLAVIDSRARINFVICKPPFGIRTKDAYSMLQHEKCAKNLKTGRLVRALCRGDTKGIAKCLHNDFEHSLFREYPLLREIKEAFIDAAALNAVVSGSGSAVFCIAEDAKTAKSIASKMKRYGQVFTAVSVNS